MSPVLMTGTELRSSWQYLLSVESEKKRPCDLKTLAVIGHHVSKVLDET